MCRTATQVPDGHEQGIFEATVQAVRLKIDVHLSTAREPLPHTHPPVGSILNVAWVYAFYFISALYTCQQYSFITGSTRGRLAKEPYCGMNIVD